MKSINRWTDPKTGKRYVAVESDFVCEGCAFEHSAEMQRRYCWQKPSCMHSQRPDKRNIIWQEVQPTRKPDSVAVNRLALDLYVTLNTALDMSMGVKTPRRGLAPHVRPAYLALARWVLRRYERKS